MVPYQDPAISITESKAMKTLMKETEELFDVYKNPNKLPNKVASDKLVEKVDGETNLEMMNGEKENVQHREHEQEKEI